MEIIRDQSVEMLAAHKRDGMVKVLTGIRDCGKSHLLFHSYYHYLMEQGIEAFQIIGIHLDLEPWEKLRRPTQMAKYVRSRIRDNKKIYYLMIDEFQLMKQYEKVLSTLAEIRNLDIYMTGSDQKALLAASEKRFGGRGEKIRIYPLTFHEFIGAFGGTWEAAFEEYSKYGGLPALLSMDSHEEKVRYLKERAEQRSFPDFARVFEIRNREQTLGIFRTLAAMAEIPVNPYRIAKKYEELTGSPISNKTVSHCLDCMEKAGFLDKAGTFDVRKKKFVGTSARYFLVDPGLGVGLRGFAEWNRKLVRQEMIFYELKRKGCEVASGVVVLNTTDEKKKSVRKKLDIDFVLKRGMQMGYVQCALDGKLAERLEEAEMPLKRIPDSFEKTMVIGNSLMPVTDESGIRVMGMQEFMGVQYHFI